MKGDFLGFSFDGVHCSELGITHVSGGDRYDENLHPEVRDKSVEIPGNHGEYFYGSTYGTRAFDLAFAYDHITETQFRMIRKLFSSTKPCELIFDERPYKVYFAKIESPLEMNYICFDEQKKHASETPQDGVRIIHTTEERPKDITENFIVPPHSSIEYELEGEPLEEPAFSTTDNPPSISVDGLTYTFTNNSSEYGNITIEYTIMAETLVGTREQVYPWIYEYNEDGSPKMERIYKGEGTISFICHFPFARQLFKIKELYTPQNDGGAQGNLITNFKNVDEWIESSGILTQSQFNTFNIDKVIASNSNDYTYEIPVYNPGDLDVGFCLYIPFDSNGQILPKDGKSVIIINGDEDVLFLSPIEKKGKLKKGKLADYKQEDTGILINTVNHLIEGVNFSNIAHVHDYRTPAWQTTGNIYNEHIIRGDFPHIKRNDWKLDNTHYPQGIHISCKEIEEQDKEIIIYYNYLYF